MNGKSKTLSLTSGPGYLVDKLPPSTSPSMPRVSLGAGPYGYEGKHSQDR